MMNSSRIRRAGLVVGAITAVTLALSGCAGTTPATSSKATSAAKVTIRVTWWGGDSRTVITNKAIALFEKKYPNITVQPEQSEFAGYWDKLATQVAGNDAPDVIQMAETYLSTYAGRGALLDLTGNVDTKKIDSSILKTGQIDGKLYGLPSGITTWAVLENTTLQKKNGIAIPDDSTWTWADLAKTSAAITKASGGDYWGMQTLGHDVSALQVWAHQHGEELWNAKGKVTISEATLASWWQYILDEEDAAATPPASVNVEGMTGTQPPTATNKAEIGAWPANQISQYATTSGSDFTILKVPAAKSGKNAGAYFAPTMFWSGYSKSKHPKETEEFIDFMTNNAQAAAVLGADRGVSANSALRAEAAKSATGTDLILSKYIESISKDVKWTPAPTPVGASSVNDLLVRYSTEVFFKRSTPDAAAKGFITDLKAAIAGA
jgi:multiple sugar transport system substrate-binding protein